MNTRNVHALVKAERWPEAWQAVNPLLNERPDSPELLYLAGCILRSQGHIGLSLALFSKALSKDRKQPNLWMHYGATLHDLNDWDNAVEAFQVVHKMLPTDPMPPANIAASMTQKGRWRDAITWADKALALDPECYIAHISKGFACLALGRWLEGFEHHAYLYENHLHVRVYNSPENEEPTWDGSPGKTVVVQCDQGVGDILMYGQCLKQMQDDCKEVILECAPRLVNLMRRNFPGVTVYGTLKQVGQDWALNHAIDAHIHISAIPKFYRKLDAHFPRASYIRPDEAMMEKWMKWLKQFPRPWNGVSWKGGVQQSQAHIRSLQLYELAPVLNLPGSFFDLSYKDNHREIAAWNIQGGSQVIVPPIDQSDYDDTIAFVACLDEIATVTTAVVHACGAIGRTARVLVPEVPMWRYAHRCGDGMIWYPENSVRLYRRAPGEDWSSTIRRLAHDMKPMVIT